MDISGFFGSLYSLLFYRHQREVVADLRRGLNNQEQECRAARSHVESCKQARIRHQREVDQQRISVQRAEDRVEELKEILEKENVEDGSLDILRETLKDAEEEKRVNEGSYSDSVEAMNAIMNSLREIRKELKAKDDKIATLQEELRIARSEEQTVHDKRRQILSAKNAVVERIDDAKNHKARLSRRKDEINDIIVDYEEKASLVSPRVPVDEGETPSSLDHKLERFHRDMQRYNQEWVSIRGFYCIRANHLPDSERLERSLLQKLQRRLWHTSVLRNISENSRCLLRYATSFLTEVDHSLTIIQIFAETLRHRKDRWGIFRSHISSRAKAQFTYLLSERSFRGRLLADHNGKLLDLQVCTGPFEFGLDNEADHIC